MIVSWFMYQIVKSAVAELAYLPAMICKASSNVG